MRGFKLTHLQDAELLHGLSTLVARDRRTTARLLAHIAEVDARRLYLPAGYPSMFLFCVEELRLSEDAAFRRIGAARVAREHPALFDAIADGRIHLTAVQFLATHLTAANADELIRLASGCTRAELAARLARQFPRAEALRLDGGVSPVAATSTARLVSERAENAGNLEDLGGTRVSPPARVEPLSPARYLLEFSIPASTHAKLRRAQALLSHAEPDPDLARVLDRALDALIERLERRKAGAARRPARLPRPSRHARHIPAHVRRAVWERDRGRCTFVGPGGRVCGVTRRIEFDHVDPVARGGRASVDGVRLRCRAHNQFEAERVFGVEFMRGKRAQRRVAAADRPGPAPGPGGWAEADARTREVVAGLRALGMRGAEARHAASIAAPAAGASIEEHLRAALRTHLGRGIRFTASTPHPPG